MANYCPITGHPCHNPPIYVITEQLGDKTQSTSCCRECAVTHIQQRNEMIRPQASESQVTTKELLHGLLSGFFPTTASSVKICHGCGSTFNHILKTGAIGCKDCYTVFSEELKPYLIKVQPGDQHVGKVPKSALIEEISPEQQIILLEKVMKEAANSGDYELAAKYRDMIKKIKGSN